MDKFYVVVRKSVVLTSVVGGGKSTEKEAETIAKNSGLRTPFKDYVIVKAHSKRAAKEQLSMALGV